MSPSDVRQSTPARVGVGCARLGEATGGVSWRQAVAMVRAAADAGIDYFDTADAYTNGTSERLLGKALAGRRTVTIATKAGYLFRPRSELEARARIVVGPVVQRLGRSSVTTLTQGADKYGAQDFTAEYIRSAVDACCQRLGTDQLDVLQMHAPRGVDVDAVGAVGRELVDRGRVRQFGVAAEEPAEAEPWLGQVQAVQVPFSVFDVSAGPMIARAKALGASVVVRSVLGTGRLLKSSAADISSADRELILDLGELARASGRTVQDIAIGFARTRPGVDVALVGVRVPHHVSDLIASVHRPPLPDDVLERVEAAVRRRHGAI